jgi:1-deoxy-D-xylulose-5-phosphate synthase
MIRDGMDIAILTLGHVGNFVNEACPELDKTGIRVAHYDLRFLKPLDEGMLHEVFGRFRKIITVEDGVIQGGMGSAVLEFMADHGYSATVKRLGIPDRFIEQGSTTELYHECGFDAEGILHAAKEIMK